MDEDRWLTVQQIAAMLQIDDETVRRWLRSGELPGLLLGRKGGYRVQESDLTAFLDRQKKAVA